ncbi:hypothetical protein [Photobacterium sp. GSS17]|uniref:hypothetical protein n=1 Tax=Photobacterium sp. GSS17 TaxID=3020715 RepID=UPI00235F5155|nr:hypothetical protein [Photobacterium sp. GSS17]
MKKFTAVSALLFLMSGCASNDIETVVNDGINGAISGVFGSSQKAITAKTNIPASGAPRTYSVEAEHIATYEAKKSSRDYGTIKIARQEKNPKGQTRLVLDFCAHPGIGKVKCSGSIYQVTSEGWLVDKGIYFGGNSSFNEIVVPAGSYYLKVRSDGVGKESYTTGTFSVSPYKTSYVQLELE